MDLGIYTWFGFNYSFSDIIKLIKEAGFQYVMTWWGDEFENFTGQKNSIRKLSGRSAWNWKTCIFLLRE
jgi:hypothetical protein